MTVAHSARRGLATAAGGLVVVGAGATTGVVVADMHSSWTDQQALQAASEVAAEPADVAPVRPVVITLIEERHITPDPVIVRKKVYRTRVVTGPGGVAQPAAPARPAARPSAPRSTTKSPAKPRPAAPRTVVAPAPKAPAPAPAGNAGSGTTSKTS